jgi:alkylation response protein AidB-like acyl-CoA dehydrogenase
MIFALDTAEQAFIDKVKNFVNTEVLPETRKWEENTAFPDAIWPRLGELGILSMVLPKNQGGLGLSCKAYVEACRILAHGDPALSMNVAAINALCVAHIAAFGTDEQKEKYLPGIIKGDIKLAWGLTEPDAGSDARRVKTVATFDESNPGWANLNGEKMFITNGGKADLIITIARTGEAELSAFLMETAQPGWELVQRIHTIGVRASNTVHFKMTDAKGWHTPCTFEQATGLLYRGRLGIAAMAVGIAENMLADNEEDLEAARLLLHKGAEMFDQGMNVVKASSMAKLFASEVSNRVTNNAIQIHGGRGMTFEFLVEKLWRDAKLTEIGEGCSEIQRMVIAKQSLR